MPQISTHDFKRLPLRVHDFLAGVPPHDVWAVDLPRVRSGITLDGFWRAASVRPLRPSPVARAPEHPSVRRPAPRLGLRAGRNREGDLRDPSDSRRSLEIRFSGGHARAALPNGVPLRERAVSRGDQPHRPRCRHGPEAPDLRDVPMESQVLEPVPLAPRRSTGRLSPGGRASCSRPDEHR